MDRTVLLVCQTQVPQGPYFCLWVAYVTSLLRKFSTLGYLKFLGLQLECSVNGFKRAALVRLGNVGVWVTWGGLKGRLQEYRAFVMRPFLLLWKIKDFSSCYLQMFSMSWVSPVWQYIHNVVLHIPWVHEYHNTYINFKFDELWPVFTPLHQLDIENQWLLLAYWCTNWVKLLTLLSKGVCLFKKIFISFRLNCPICGQAFLHLP